ncbi:hypothetical protein [Acetobacter estunensis]|uniref:hypothetical protein n=1 Tax=Acetobacter estunensis TaxID=104097 RepID=UPI0018886140|nr:hypothetical protein [Acetobacter estunensis]
MNSGSPSILSGACSNHAGEGSADGLMDEAAGAGFTPPGTTGVLAGTARTVVASDLSFRALYAFARKIDPFMGTAVLYVMRARAIARPTSSQDQPALTIALSSGS